MKYSLLAAALVTLIFTGCDQLRRKSPEKENRDNIPPASGRNVKDK